VLEWCEFCVWPWTCFWAAAVASVENVFLLEGESKFWAHNVLSEMCSCLPPPYHFLSICQLAAESSKFPTDSCKFPTEDMSCQNFDSASKCPLNGGFLPQILYFWNERKFFDRLLGGEQFKRICSWRHLVMSGNGEKSNVLKNFAQLLDYFKRTNSLHFYAYFYGAESIFLLLLCMFESQPWILFCGSRLKEVV